MGEGKARSPGPWDTPLRKIFFDAMDGPGASRQHPRICRTCGHIQQRWCRICLFNWKGAYGTTGK